MRVHHDDCLIVDGQQLGEHRRCFQMQEVAGVDELVLLGVVGRGEDQLRLLQWLKVIVLSLNDQQRLAELAGCLRAVPVSSSSRRVPADSRRASAISGSRCIVATQHGSSISCW